MPTVPVGYNELRMAGGIRQEPVKLVDGITVKAKAIAYAEVIIEGRILPNVREAEDQNTHTGHAMPEFPGYDGDANPSLPVIEVTAITTRKDPILQTLVGPGEEHVNLAGLPTEGSIYDACHKAMPGFITGVYCHPAGGGKFLGIVQCEKKSAFDDGRPDYDPTLPARGTTSKTIFDATVPFHMKARFKRAKFRDVDPRPFAPELNLKYP